MYKPPSPEPPIGLPMTAETRGRSRESKGMLVLASVTFTPSES